MFLSLLVCFDTAMNLNLSKRYLNYIIVFKFFLAKHTLNKANIINDPCQFCHVISQGEVLHITLLQQETYSFHIVNFPFLDGDVHVVPS